MSQTIAAGVGTLSCQKAPVQESSAPETDRATALGQESCPAAQAAARPRSPLGVVIKSVILGGDAG